MNIKQQYAFFVCLGVASYTTYYFMMASVNYWQILFDTKYTTIASMLAIFGELLGTYLGITFAKRNKSDSSIYAALISNGLCLVAVIIFYFLPYLARYYLTMIPITICGIVSGMYYTVLIRYAASLGSVYVQNLLLGVGISEIVIQLIKDFFSLFLKEDVSNQSSLLINTSVYYSIAICYLIICIILWHIFVKDRQKQLKYRSSQLLDTSNDETLIVQYPNLKKIVFPQCLLQCINYSLTYITFPAIITAIPGYMFYNKDPTIILHPWWNLINLTNFFVFDFIGRLVAKAQRIQKIFTTVFGIVIQVIRLIIFIVFVLMTLPRPNIENKILPIIHSDILSMILVAAFSFAGGLSTSSLYVVKARKHMSKSDIVKASEYITIYYQLGLVIGSLSGFGLSFIVKD